MMSDPKCNVRCDTVSEMIFLSIKRLSPLLQLKNPLLFITYFGAICTAIIGLVEIRQNMQDAIFMLHASFWLWMAVILGNFSEVVAEQGGKLRSRALRKTQLEIFTNKMVGGALFRTSSIDLQKGDIIVCEAGEIIPSDGDVIEGAAMVDESAITGESAPVMRESGGINSSISAGTKVLNNRITVKVTSEQGKSFLDHVIELASGEGRESTLQEQALQIVLLGVSIILFIIIISMNIFIGFVETSLGGQFPSHLSPSMLFVIFLCLIPTAVAALSDAILIAGLDRLFQKGLISKSGQWLESIADVDLVVMDKTGTLTIGNRQAVAFMPILGLDERFFAHVAMLGSYGDETPEGKSIINLAKSQYGLFENIDKTIEIKVIPFNSESRMSGVDYYDENGAIVRKIRKGAQDVIKEYIENSGGVYYAQIDGIVKSIAYQGATPLLVCDDKKILGVIKLTDIIKPGIKDCSVHLRMIGAKTLLITGDNPLTASAVTAQCGVDDFVGAATPENKLDVIKHEQRKGYFVVMIGDGNDDAPSLAQADVGISMNTGTQTSRDAANMVDLDSNPIKICEVIYAAKQILITRGVVGICSIGTSLVKYAAIIPVILASVMIDHHAGINMEGTFNIFGLSSLRCAIISALILNVLSITVLMPMSLRGLHLRNKLKNIQRLFCYNIVVYGMGSVIVSMAALKLISLTLNFVGL